MRLHATAFALLTVTVSTASAHHVHRHAHLLHKRQDTTAAPTTTVSLTGLTASGAPPLDSITFGMSEGPAQTATTIYPPGATPPVSGADGLPSFTLVASEWPQLDTIPPTDSPDVQEWMKELEGIDIPDLKPTVDGSCGNDTAAAADAQNRGWWTCGGWTRDTDIVSCPDKYTWGVSFDDGPGPYTPTLLGFLDEKDILATFFVTGSRTIERPDILRQEYMAGHEISVHTWSHHALTAMTNEQVVAELGWTRKAIKAVLGVSPTTMRPPFGDIDDRVRAISLAMGMVPIMWTSTAAGEKFDSNDWRAAANLSTGAGAFGAFQNILTQASMLDSGIIVLEHDLYEITVDLAFYMLPAAQNFKPPFTLKSIGQCLGLPPTAMYVETNTNTSFPPPAPTTTVTAGSSDSGGNSGSTNTQTAKVASQSSTGGNSTNGGASNNPNSSLVRSETSISLAITTVVFGVLFSMLL